MRSRVTFGLAALVGALAIATAASATVSEALSLRELVQQSEHVVLATAIEQRARRDSDGRIVTEHTVRVDEVMRGPGRAGQTLVMTSLGGVLGDLGMRVEGEPHLEVGSRYVLFLRRMGGVLRPVGMSQGVLPVREGTEPVVLPGGAGLSLVQQVRGGRLAPAPAALLHPEPYVELRDRVGRIVEDERGTVRP